MKFSVLIASLAPLASAVCHYGTELFPRSELSARAGPAFGYHELTGPLDWHGLSRNNSACALGKNQSPINVLGSEATVRGNTFNFSPNNKPHGAEFENLGSTVEVFTDGTATFNRKRYNLLQFHFHTPSEHHLDGEYFPGEVHFVFQAADLSLAVIGFLIEIAGGNADTTSPVIEAVLSAVRSIPQTGDTVHTPALDFNSLKNHLKNSNVHQYAGSLTTPPCTEGVTFNVVANPIYITAATFRALKDVVKFNSRYTQDIPGQINLLDNARVVLDS